MARVEHDGGGGGSTGKSAKPPASRSKLSAYRAKRNFATSSEPKGRSVRRKGNRFVIQRHDARRLHFDLRLELNGVLKSWAVTRGPSLDPKDKRLSIHTEDHPLEYLSFEGVIPKGEYGGGTMIVWDHGTWVPEGDAEAGLAKGHLEFTLQGRRLQGRWHLIRMKGRGEEAKEPWLLVKGEDEQAVEANGAHLVESELTSLLTGQTNKELEKGGVVRKDHAARQAATGSAVKGAVKAAARVTPKLPAISKAKKALLPVFVEPSLATLVDVAPSGPEWLHEIKFDGYRLQARIDGNTVKLLTRKGLDWTSKFRAIADALRATKLGSALIDGEVVVETEAGLSSFSALQEAISSGQSERMVFYAFDLLYLDGTSMAAAPLVERKTLLATLFEDAPEGGAIRFAEHIETEGGAMLRHACRLGLEGIVSKRKDQPYRSGRAHHWLKTKCTDRQELVVAGFMPSTTAAKAIGSLILGTYENGDLIHVGRAGTGFTEAVARDIYEKLVPLKRTTHPFREKPSALASRNARWVEPELVAEVELRGWTADGQVRHAAFKGLREDKDPREVVRETPERAQPKQGIRAASKAKTKHTASTRAESIQADHFPLTHPDRIFWPDIGLTKLGLAEFYAEISDWILPHIVNRPLSLLRCPNGIEGERFFQKHAWAGMDDAIQRHEMNGEELISIRDLDGLIALVQAGALEIHPWGSTLDKLEQPDRITFDLDPDEALDWQDVVAAAFEVKDRLAELKLESFVKTSGGKGLHVAVPITPKRQWDEVKSFTKGFVERMAKDSPERYTASIAKRSRAGRIFVDYLRNGRGATAVAAYSTRARAGAPVSTPVAWDELRHGVRPSQFTAENFVRRIGVRINNPWDGFDDVSPLRWKGEKVRSK